LSPLFSVKERSTKENEATARLRCKTGIYISHCCHTSK
jgi:hypothetical protein